MEDFSNLSAFAPKRRAVLDKAPSKPTGADSVLGMVVREADEEATNTIVFLHGFGGQADQWKPLWRHLDRKHTRLIAYDLPGHAGSLHYPNAGSAKTAAKAICAAIKDLGPIHLVGHSKGGAVACLVAMFQPDSVSSMTLLSPGGFGAHINVPLLRAYGSARDRRAQWALMPHFYGPNFKIPISTMDRMFGMRARNGQIEMLEKIASIITSDDGTQGQLPLDAIVALGKPIEVLWGYEDDIIPVEQAEALGAGFDVTIFNQVGHQIYEEVPEIVAAHIGLAIRKS